MPGFQNNTFLLTILILLFCLCFESIQAKPPLPWSNVIISLPKIWKKKYPIEVQKFIANPDKQGILMAWHKGKKIYYYKFDIVVHKPYRAEDEKLKIQKYSKTIELWLRYRPHLINPFDLSFARMDRLPGKRKRWIK